MSRLSNSWELVKASWGVLRADKELVVFPIVSMIGTILVMIMFAIPAAIMGVFSSDNSFNLPEFVLAFLFYVVMYSVVIFSNSALVGAAMIRLKGGDPTVRDGFRIASQHIGPILGYAVISATVGMALQALRNRKNVVGQIVAWIGEMAWNLMTYLVVPILVVEGVGPVEAIKRSAGMLKRTWGEQIVGNFSIGLVFGLITLAAVFVIGLPLILLASATGSAVLIVFAVIVIVLLVMGISLIGSTLNGIYVAAVYRYAAEGATSSYFAPEVISGAFGPK
jgi:hypothetical protein